MKPPIIFIVIFFLNGCASIYANYPEIKTDALTYPEKPVKIKYTYNNKLTSTILNEYKYELPQNHRGVQFINHQHEGVPSIGNYVEIHIDWRGLPHDYDSTYHNIGMWTLFVIPYFDTADINIDYTLYSNGKISGIYNYVAHDKFVVWSPLFPVFWINLLYNNFGDTIDNTLYQFINDAYSDRKLITSH